MGKSIEKRIVHIRERSALSRKDLRRRDWKEGREFHGISGSCQPVFIPSGSQFQLERGTAIVIKGLLELT
jgi:hypothetical protein